MFTRKQLKESESRLFHSIWDIDKDKGGFRFIKSVIDTGEEKLYFCWKMNYFGNIISDFKREPPISYLSIILLFVIWTKKRQVLLQGESAK